MKDGFSGSIQRRSLAILSWNCQGSGNPRTVRRLKAISKKFDPDIIFIMESKNPDAVVLKKLEHLRYDYHHLVTPTGHGAGGLGLFWKQGLNLQVIESNAQVIDTTIEFEGKTFYSSFVHASTDRNQRSFLWDQLVTKAIIREEAWFYRGFQRFTLQYRKGRRAREARRIFFRPSHLLLRGRSV